MDNVEGQKESDDATTTKLWPVEKQKDLVRSEPKLVFIAEVVRLPLNFYTAAAADTRADVLPSPATRWSSSFGGFCVLTICQYPI